jgi:hypothetical protein
VTKTLAGALIREELQFKCQELIEKFQVSDPALLASSSLIDPAPGVLF